MLREFREDILYCYRDKRHLRREIVRAVLWIGGSAVMLFLLERYFG